MRTSNAQPGTDGSFVLEDNFTPQDNVVGAIRAMTVLVMARHESTRNLAEAMMIPKADGTEGRGLAVAKETLMYSLQANPRGWAARIRTPDQRKLATSLAAAISDDMRRELQNNGRCQPFLDALEEMSATLSRVRSLSKSLASNMRMDGAEANARETVVDLRTAAANPVEEASSVA